MNIKKLITNWKTTSSGLLLMIGSATHLAFQIKANAVDEGAISIFAVGFLGGIGLILAADGKTPPPDDSASSGSAPGNKLGLLLAFALLGGMVAAPAVFTGCTTNHQRIAYNTLYSVERATVAAYDGYMDSVIAGTTSTNGVPKVSKAFNAYQASFLAALSAVQFQTNALAPASLVVESQDLVNLILNLKGK